MPASLDISTMFLVRDWERFQYLIQYENHQVTFVYRISVHRSYKP